jgi:hypothetical protein
MPDETAPDLPSEPAPDPLDVEHEKERLDQLGKKIEDVKRHAEHDLDPHHEDETFIGGRRTPDEDDTIAPG